MGRATLVLKSMKFEKSNFMEGLSEKSRPFHPAAPAQAKFDGSGRKTTATTITTSEERRCELL